jgi:hypothetical protein
MLVRAWAAERPADRPRILKVIVLHKLSAVLLYLILASPYAFSAQGKGDVDRIEKQLINAHGGKEADLRARLAKALVAQAADEYEHDNMEQGDVSLDKALSECERAATIAIAAGKKEKTVEIRLREISRRLNEIARLVPFDDRAHIEQVRRSVEALRTRLLDHMFKKK